MTTYEYHGCSVAVSVTILELFQRTALLNFMLFLNILKTWRIQFFSPWNNVKGLEQPKLLKLWLNFDLHFRFKYSLQETSSLLPPTQSPPWKSFPLDTSTTALVCIVSSILNSNKSNYQGMNIQVKREPFKLFCHTCKMLFMTFSSTPPITTLVLQN